MRAQASPRLASFGAVFALVGACSLINSPDDVKPQTTDTGGSSSTAGKAADGGKNSPVGGDGQTPPNAGEGGTSSSNGGEIGVAGAGGEATGEDPGPGLNPTTGILVLGSQDTKKTRHLSVLNGRTGKELAVETLPVAAIAYDEAPARHAWFVFTAGAFPAQPTGTADLEIRHYNDATGKWFVVGRVTALPPPEPDQVVVLNNRVAYLSHRVVAGKAVSSLTVLDTTDLTNVTELVTRNADTGATFVGLTGDRGSDVNATALGGRLRLMISSDCAADCDLAAQQIFVAANLTDGTSLSLDRFVGEPRFAKARTEDRLYVALRSTKPSSRMVIRSFLGPDLTSPTLVTIAGFMGDDVGGFVLGECEQAGSVTDVAGKQLFAFNLVSGMSQAVALTNPGAQLYFETFGSTVISLDPSVAPGLRAFEVSKSGAANVAVNELSLWKPNGAFMPLLAATRRGESFKCP
jgi:hypothetical protein